jgi:hypothetical protein
VEVEAVEELVGSTVADFGVTGLGAAASSAKAACPSRPKQT